MLDQATRLRQMAAAYRAQSTAPGPESPGPRPAGAGRTKAIAVTSGKGGVGKTNISINLAHGLLSLGKQVILLDADLGLANADILLGTVPPYHLGHLLRGERQMSELIHRTPTGLKLIAGGNGVEELANLSPERLHSFVAAMQQLEGQADYLILDTGAGLSNTVLEFVLAADQVVVVTTPEPTSLADAYATIKTLARRLPDIDVQLVVNQVERPEEGAHAAERIISTARSFLGINVTLLGTIPRDPTVWQAVRKQTPFSLAFPHAPASRAVGAMARKLGTEGPGAVDPQRPRTGFFDRLAGFFGRKAI